MDNATGCRGHRSPAFRLRNGVTVWVIDPPITYDVEIIGKLRLSGGGGVSTVFALPAWQDGLQTTATTGGAAPLTMRGVPDVSGDADPETGYDVRIDGTNTVIGGTSAVAPLWAGLIARINATNGSPVGFINPTLYATPAALHAVTTGNNGDFAAGPGWNACTGLGSPDGGQIATLLGSATGSLPAS